MRSYLSIDLDYWSELNAPPKKMCDYISYKFFKKVCALNLPIKVVRDHELLLPHINSTKCDTLYNVDFHSDIFGYEDEGDEIKWSKREPDCGTWANYVSWRKTGTFHWMYPQAYCYGKYGKTSDNEGMGVCWISSYDNPYLTKVIKPFKTMLGSKGVNRIDWSSIVAIGISVSPEYSKLDKVERILETLKIKRCSCFNDNTIMMDVEKKLLISRSRLKKK